TTAEKLGDTGHYKIILTGLYNDGSWPLSATFTSSDVAVATVDPYGFLTALKNGFVEVSTVYNGTTYKKGLFVYTTLDAGESEGNNTKDVADVMAASTADPSIGKFYKGTLLAGDIDWFKFTLSQGTIVNVGYLSQSATADVQMDLYNDADTLMASAISANGAPLILPVGLSAGSYYIKLTPTGDIDQTGNYIVTYKILENLPAKTAIPIAFSETKTATIDTLADKQDLSFSLASDQAIRIIFTPSSPSAKYRLTLLNGSQTVIDRIDCLNQQPVSFQAIYGSGSYTLQVTPVEVVDVQNPFTVSLDTSAEQLEKEPNDTTTQATSFDISRSTTGRLSSNTDLDLFTFQLDTPRFLELGFAATGSTGNFSLTLFKESDQYEIDGIDIANGQTTSLHMGLGAGRYYLRVKGGTTNIDTINNYTLTFTDSTQTDLEIESNNTLKVANAIDKSRAKRGRIYSAQDKDYYGFNLPEGGFLSLTFTPTTATGDYKVSLVDENYETTTIPLYAYTSTNGETVTAADIYIDIPGNYYIKVEPNGGIDQYNPYVLNLTSSLAIVGLKQLVNVAVTGQNQTMTASNTQTLTARASYSDATIAAVTPAWTSLNQSVATVNAATGLVTAVAQGTTSIVASYGGITGKFDLTVGAPQNVVKQHYGNLILVGGGGYLQTNTLKESTMYLTDLVYRRFRERLFADDDIYYLHPWPAHDLNGDGFSENIIRDTVPTVAKLGAAINGWAASQSTDGPLYLYLVDHGGLDYFVIHEDANHVQENLTATQLKGFIDAFQTATNRQVIVVIEACKSGSFVNDLAAEGRNRIVLTSSNDQYQFLSGAGTDTFTQFFMDKLWEGDSLYTAFEKARQKLSTLGKPYNQQIPQLYQGVSLAANNVKIGGDFAVAGAIPSFIEQSPSRPITANSS
ncbi:MAG: Ig-like domain-containing protein, partial [Deltaproteobacteria bacterium]